MVLPLALKKRVLAIVDSVQPASRYKVLVIDRKVKQLLDLVVEKAELLNRQVANVLILDEPRQTETYLEAVYIVEHSDYSFGCIQADFIRQPRRYAAAHVFLLPKLGSSQAALERFQNSSIAPHLRIVEPAALSFLAIESRLYSLGVVHANTVLYNQHCRDLSLELVDMTGRQLADLCEALQVNPFVRFSARWQVTRANSYPAVIARSAAQHIEQARQRYMTPQMDSEPRPTLLILDRTVDLTAPLRHEFGLQSMALDVLDNQFQPRNTLREFTAATAKSRGETAHTLTERDNTWVDLRHKHIVVVTEELNAKIRVLRSANPHLADPTSKDVSVGDVRNMLAALPEFMKERESVAVTLDMALECMAAVEKMQLKSVAEFEQTVTLGTTPEGINRPEVKLADVLITILGHKSVDHDMRIRALALYALYRGGLRRTDYNRLQHHAHLKDEDVAAVQALGYLGNPVTYMGQSADKLPRALVREHAQQPLLYSRVQTGLQTVLTEFINGALDGNEYPYAGDAPDVNQEMLSTATSLRNPRQRATWAQNVTSKPSASAAQGGPGADGRKNKKKLVMVFVVGGFTASEAQAVYQLSESTAFSIVLGGHDLLTPKKFLEFLRNMNTTREALALDEDRPDPAVPDFLNASDHQNNKTRANSAAQLNPQSASRQGSPANQPPQLPLDKKQQKQIQKQQKNDKKQQWQQQQQQQPQQQQPQQQQQQAYQPQAYQPQAHQPQAHQSQPYQPLSYQPQAYSQPSTYQPQGYASNVNPYGSSSADSASNSNPYFATPPANNPYNSSPVKQAPITPTTILSGPPGNSSFSQISEPPHKEKKDMKHRLKGAFKLKK